MLVVLGKADDHPVAWERRKLEIIHTSKRRRRKQAYFLCSNSSDSACLTTLKMCITCEAWWGGFSTHVGTRANSYRLITLFVRQRIEFESNSSIAQSPECRRVGPQTAYFQVANQRADTQTCSNLNVRYFEQLWSYEKKRQSAWNKSFMLPNYFLKPLFLVFFIKNITAGSDPAILAQRRHTVRRKALWSPEG